MPELLDALEDDEALLTVTLPPPTPSPPLPPVPGSCSDTVEPHAQPNAIARHDTPNTA